MENMLELNVSKCAILSLFKSDRKIIRNYTMNDTALNRVNEFRDLGITIDEKLTFKKHMDSLISSCNSIIGFIGRTGRNFDRDTLVTLFNAFVKSKLLFGILIWYPSADVYRILIENVQNRFTMMALREWPNAQNGYRIRPQQVRYEELGLTKIINRYEFSCCLFVYDLLNSKLVSNYLSEKITWNNQTRVSEMINVPRMDQDYIRNQPFWSAIRHFNVAKLQYISNNDREKNIKDIKILKKL